VAENESEAIPASFVLEQNYPNPFNPSTRIAYDLPRTTHVHLAIYDVLGRKVATLVNTVQLPGAYAVRFEASQLGSGLYFYRLETDFFTQTRKMLLAPWHRSILEADGIYGRPGWQNQADFFWEALPMLSISCCSLYNLLLSSSH
jgi:hypothetical protein